MSTQAQDAGSAVLLISCPDQKGIVAEITRFLYENRGNIINLDQHVDFTENIFFSRVEWDMNGFVIPREKISPKFAEIAQQFGMQWELHFSDVRPRMAIFVSKHTHCLYEILARVQARDWDLEIPLIISNHPDSRHIADQFRIDFHETPITPETKAAQEQRQLELLKTHKVDFIVLARYMQILTPAVINRYPHKIINIHHSFLPAFPGAKPYHSAFARGVKIIGATSHYVTAELDAGPIIEQDIIRISHKDTLQNLIRKGKDLEKIVLARAIWYHFQHKILVYNNKTVIFE